MYKICKDKDPTCMNSEINLACNSKAKICKRYVKNGHNIADQHSL